jgi:hypothetical protein
MSKKPYGANPDMLLLFAWLSTLGLAELVRKDREVHPWERPPSWDRSWNPSFPEEILRKQVETALCCFQHDPIYGSVLEALARYRLTFIDFTLLSWAIELQDLTDPAAAFYISDDPYYSEQQQKTTVIDETDAFWKAVTSHVPLADRLNRVSKTWCGDVCRGACGLRSFFDGYLDLIQRPLRIPFFLVELTRRSLLKIDWHAIAANVLAISHPAQEECHCAGIEIPVGTVVEYLGELLKTAGDEIIQLGQNIPEPERTQVLLLADLCRETTRAMRVFSSEQKQHGNAASLEGPDEGSIPRSS